MIVQPINKYGHLRGIVSYPARVLRSKEAFEKFRLQNLTRFHPIEHKTRGELITNEELRALYTLANELPEDEQKYFREYIEETKKENLKRAKEWAEINMSLGTRAASHAAYSIFFGIAKSYLENSESDSGEFDPNELAKRLVNIGLGYTLGQRGKDQFSIHARDDDELGMNLYQEKEHGNITSGQSGIWACFSERFVNPTASPLIGLLDNKTRNNLFYLLMLPKLVWWRIRYSAYIDQRFSTSLLTYLVNLPFALLGNKKSKKTVEDIKSSGVISFSNIRKRIKENLGVKEGESTIKRLFDLTAGLVSGNTKKLKDGAKYINEGMGAITGTIGAFLVTIFIPLKAAIDLLHVETGDKTKKAINFSATAPFCSQQSHYFSRFSIPEFVKFKEIIEKLKNPELNPFVAKHKEEYEELAKERKKSFFYGLAANFTGMLLPFTKLLPDSSQSIKIFKSFISEISNIVLLLFLSFRRVLEGKTKVLEIKQKEEEEQEKARAQDDSIYDKSSLN